MGEDNLYLPPSASSIAHFQYITILQFSFTKFWGNYTLYFQEIYIYKNFTKTKYNTQTSHMCIEGYIEEKKDITSQNTPRNERIDRETSNY